MYEIIKGSKDRDCNIKKWSKWCIRNGYHSQASTGYC